MERVFNFSSGPAILPLEVLEKARDELVNWRGHGMSVMEMSHRGKEYAEIHAEAKSSLRELMEIPSNYKILFLQGGASSQFAMVPMNLLRGKTSADYLNTGEWSQRAISEAKKYCQVNVVASSEDKKFSYAPTQNQWKLDPNASYVHFTPNETIGGVEIFWTPETGNAPLVADMSSTILSRPVDVAKYGLIYAGAQKNIGPAGLTVVIVREDLLGHTVSGAPTMYDYKIHADNDSMYNTAPTYSVYMAGLVFNMLRAGGGLPAIEKINRAKARLLYDTLDSSSFFISPVAKENRSLMNVPFALKDPTLDEVFLKGAEEYKLTYLRGHRSVGGMRASIYNAMPVEGVQTLVDYMRKFEKQYG